MDLLDDFGLRIKELRARSGMSQEILAARAGLDRSYIGGVERGERNISLQNIERIAAALYVTVPYLFSDERFSTQTAYLKKDFQSPLSERFAYHVDDEHKLVSWQLKGAMSVQETDSMMAVVLRAFSRFPKGEARVLVDQSKMKSEGEIIVYSPEIAEKAINFQKKLISYCDIIIVLCNSQYMVNQLDQVAQSSGIAHKTAHIYGKSHDMIEQAYQFLGVNRMQGKVRSLAALHSTKFQYDDRGCGGSQ